MRSYLWAAYPVYGVTLSLLLAIFGFLGGPAERFQLQRPYVTLLIGVDQPEGFRGRADAISLWFVESRKPRVQSLAIYRDTLLPVGGKVDRAARIYARGGVDTLVQALRELLGTPVDGYVVLNFRAVVEIVDLIGGLELEVKKEIRVPASDPRYALRVAPGKRKLSGLEVLALLRYREPPQEDIARVRRQQEILRALYAEVAARRLWERALPIWKIWRSSVRTNLGPMEVAWLARMVARVEPEDIEFHRIPGKVGPRGTFIPDVGAARRLVRRLLGS